MRSGPRQGAPGIVGLAGRVADNDTLFDSRPLHHEVAIIQDWTEAAETEAAAERPDGCLRTAPAGPRPARHPGDGVRRVESGKGRHVGVPRLLNRTMPADAGNGRIEAAGGRFGRRFGLGGRYTSGSPGKAVPGSDMTAGIRRKPRVCKDSGGNRAGRSGRNGLFVSSILNSVNRLFDRLKTPATRRTGPGRRRSPVSPACRREAASGRRACHAA